MKKKPKYCTLKSLVLVLILFLPGAFAESLAASHTTLPNCDTFPAFTLSPYYLAIPLTGPQGYTKDQQHTICDSLQIYTVTGTMPPLHVKWPVDNQIGNQNCQTVNTPFGVLCRLLGAYKSGNHANIIAQFHPQNIPEINTMFANAAFAARYDSLMGTINSMEVVMGWNLYDGFMACVSLCKTSDTSLTAFYFSQNNGTWFASTVYDTLPISQNIAGYLNIHKAWDMLSSNDIDSDGITNFADNCPCKPNPGQEDADHDGVGDVCDNCITKPNPDQADTDLDGIGDACDNCLYFKNPDQIDSDSDGIGDSCDNCPTIANRNQRDTDQDRIGDACDNDIDGDGIINSEDPDIDGDGIPNVDDNCPWIPNPDQADYDEDGIGDFCDNCPMIRNHNQADMDNDGIGDECDLDKDGDGVPNIYDNCPSIYNPDQADADCDGIGDVCE